MQASLMRKAGKLAFIAVLTLLFFSFLGGEALAAKKPWEKIKYPELGAVEVPSYERHVLANGMVVYLMEDHAWPLVEGRVLIRTGGVYEPAGKVGLASIMGDVLRTGGTETMNSDELDATLEGMGAYIESNVGDTQGTVSFSFLSKDAKRGLELVGDVLRRPAFEDDKLVVAKTAQTSVIARRNDELMGILQREMPKAIWGAEHPYARTTEYTTIDAIERDDLVEFYEYFYHPENMMFAVWGDFDSASMLAQMKTEFEDWPRGDNPLPPLPKAPAGEPRRVLVADKEDVTQTWFAIGHVGMKMDDPDYYAMSVTNRILGGGFADRLFNYVRSELGLAYGVGSTDGVSMSHEGTFFAYCGTKSGTVEEAMGAVLFELDRIRDTEVSDEELSNAKEAMLNSYVFNFVQRNQTLTRLQTYEFLGYPSDFLEQYPDRVRTVEKADVQDVAQRRIRPEEFAIVAVGKMSDWDGDLTEFGPVEVIDITIPEPEGPEFPEPTAETIEKGRALLAGGQKAHGGASLLALAAVERVDKASLTVQGMAMGVDVTSITVFPDKTRADMSLPFGQVVQVVSPGASWVQSPQGLEDMSESDATKGREGILGDAHYIMGHIDAFQVQSLEGEMVGENMTEVVLVWISESKWSKLYFDPLSHMLVKQAEMSTNMMTQAMGLQETTYDAYKEFGGIQYATKAVVTHGGEPMMTVETQSITVNPTVDDAVFVKPQS